MPMCPWLRAYLCAYMCPCLCVLVCLHVCVSVFTWVFQIDSVQSLLTCPGVLVCVGREPFSPLLVEFLRKSSDEKLPGLGPRTSGNGARTPGNGARTPGNGARTPGNGTRSPVHGAPRSGASMCSEGHESKKNGRSRIKDQGSRVRVKHNEAKWSLWFSYDVSLPLSLSSISVIP